MAKGRLQNNKLKSNIQKECFSVKRSHRLRHWAMQPVVSNTRLRDFVDPNRQSQRAKMTLSSPFTLACSLGHDLIAQN